MALVENFVLFAAIVSVGVFIQSAAAFAAGLVIIPLMAYAGYGLPEGQTVMLVATIPQNILGLYQFRQRLDFRELAVPAALRTVAFPLGLAGLYFVDGLPLSLVKQVMGGVILLCVALLCLMKPNKSEKIHIGWTSLAFLSSGFFAGLTGTGGPMMVLWVQAHRWSTERTRAFLFAMYLIYTGPALVILWWTFGNRIVDAITSVIVLSPFLLLFSNLGLRFGTWLGRARLRQLTMLLLCIIGLAGLLSPIFKQR